MKRGGGNTLIIAAIWRDRRVRRELTIYTIARLPSGTLLLSLLLYAQRELGSFGDVGAIIALYSVSVACAAPVAGRLADRHGPRRVLRTSALIHLVGIVILIRTGDIAGLCLGAIIAGVGLPTTAACVRARWRELPEDIRVAVFAVDGIILEAVQVVGPLLVGALSALTSPTVAITASGLCAAGAATTASLFLAARPSGPPPARHWLGPLRVRSITVLLGTLALVTAALAIVEVSVVAYAAHRETPSLSGILFAVMAAGSVVGGLIFATWGTRYGAARALLILTLATAVLFVLLLPSAGLGYLVAVLFVSNIPISAVFASIFTLLGEASPPGQSAETFTWVSSANFAAISVGSAVGGWLLSATTQQCAFAAAVVLLAVAATLALALLRAAVPAAEGAEIAEATEGAQPN